MSSKNAAHLRPVLAALEPFSDVSPEVLLARQLLRRTDSKFLLSAFQLPHLLEQLREDYSILRAGGNAIATYQTLYFDTPALRCFHDHRRGRRTRHKVRIRHYPDRRVSYLEIKTKRNEAVTDKQRVQRPFGDTEMAERDREFVAGHSSLPASELQPQVWTNFRRVTLVGNHTNERVTVDCALEFVRGGSRRALSELAIVEVKQSPFSSRTPVMRALRALGVGRPASASKYCTATAFLHPGLRLNRLRPTLRNVERFVNC